jgi:hypothetical protein
MLCDMTATEIVTRLLNKEIGVFVRPVRAAQR